MTDADENNLRQEIHQLEKTVYFGNGTPSLVSRVAKIETDIGHLSAEVAQIKAAASWTVKLVVGQIIIYAISLLPRLVAALG